MSKVMSVLEKLNLVEKVNANEVGRANPESTSNNTVQEEKETSEEKKDYKEERKKQEPDLNNYSTDTAGSKEQNNTKNYVEVMDIDKVYSTFSLENSNINTIFMLGNFINALPDDLPHDIKKQSILNIVSASNINVDNLLADGEKRLEVLNKFVNDYSKSVNDEIIRYNSEIIKLTNLVNIYKTQIEDIEKLLAEQKNLIKFESRKISGIIDFFNK